MLISMVTTTFLKSRVTNILCLIWGKLQRGPSPLPTYLKIKRVIILTSAGPTAEVLEGSSGEDEVENQTFG